MIHAYKDPISNYAIRCSIATFSFHRTVYLFLAEKHRDRERFLKIKHKFPFILSTPTVVSQSTYYLLNIRSDTINLIIINRFAIEKLYEIISEKFSKL